MQYEDCPKFDYFEYDKILEWAKQYNAVVTYENTFVDGEGNVRTNDKMGHWTLVWKYGFIGFMVFKKEEEEQAKRAAALFIYLWDNGVSADIAERCAEVYAKYTLIK